MEKRLRVVMYLEDVPKEQVVIFEGTEYWLEGVAQDLFKIIGEPIAKRINYCEPSTKGFDISKRHLMVHGNSLKLCYIDYIEGGS